MPSSLVSAILPRTMRTLLPRMASSSAPSFLHTARFSEGFLKRALFPEAPQRALHGGSARTWRVYLSGEIHSDWRERIALGVQKRSLPVTLQSPITSHEDSDDCGAIILGMEEERPNWDRKGATMNLIRTRTLLEDADIVVVRFGEKYRQWNAAYEAGYAVARNKSLITLHEPSLSHMLKEVNAGALAVCEEAEQVVDVLDYVITGRLPKPRDGDRYVPIADRLGKGNKAP